MAEIPKNSGKHRYGLKGLCYKGIAILGQILC